MSKRQAFDKKLSRPFLAPGYMKAFQCIGPDCEDTCCRDWRIGLDEADYRNVADACAQKGVRYEPILGEVDPGATHPFGYAALDLTSRDACFFHEDGLCAIQRDCGASFMPKSCVAYPRSITRFPDRLEMSGSLSCPELARLCLLGGHSSEMAPVPEQEISEQWLVNEVVQSTRRPFEIRFDSIRDWIIFFLEYPGFPLSDRLFLIARFAAATISFLGREHGSSPDARLLALAKEFDDEAYLEGLLDERRGQPGPTPAAFALLLDVISPSVKLKKASNYQKLWRQVLPVDASFETISERHRAKTQALETRFGKPITAYFTRYAVHHWRRHPYNRFPNLLIAFRSFMLHHAALKFLLINHHEIDRVMNEVDDAVGEEMLGRLMVSATQTFLRAAEHDQAFGAKLEAAAMSDSFPMTDLIGL